MTTATVDVHTVPTPAVHRSYGAVSESATPPASVISEMVTDYSEQERGASVVTVSDRQQVDETSIQHSNSEVLV